MRKIEKLKAEIENLENDLFFERQKNHSLKISLMQEEGHKKSLKEEIIQVQNKYIEEVQKNVTLADAIVILRQKLDEAERCGYIDVE